MLITTGFCNFLQISAKFFKVQVGVQFDKAYQDSLDAIVSKKKNHGKKVHLKHQKSAVKTVGLEVSPHQATTPPPPPHPLHLETLKKFIRFW